MNTRIKICGLTREHDVDMAVQAGADAIGLVLYPQSPRYVDAQRAATLASRLPPFVMPVGLFVNAPVDEVMQLLDLVPHALLQFHGDESPDYCNQFKHPYLRAARMFAGFDLLNFAQQFSCAQGLLLDAHVEGYGGGGKVFDWSLIPQNIGLPVVLSGGLHAENVADGMLQVSPCAVDVSSGVEQSKGIKDAAAMHRFCLAVRATDAHNSA
jgi:phosphoribosylanthranilate isomerase